MSLFDEVERNGRDISVRLDEFTAGADKESTFHSGVYAMNVVYERSQMAGKFGVSTLKFANYSGMRFMGVRLKTYDNEWVEGDIEEVTIAIDGGWELWDLLAGFEMILKTEEMHSKLTQQS